MKWSGIGRVNLDQISNRLALIGKLPDISRAKVEMIESWLVKYLYSDQIYPIYDPFPLLDRFSISSRVLGFLILTRTFLTCNSRIESQIDDDQGSPPPLFLSIEPDQSPDILICLDRGWSSWSERQCEGITKTVVVRVK